VTPQQVLDSAASFLATKLQCGAQYTTQLAKTLLGSGVLQWNGSSFTLDETSPTLLGLAPGLVSHQALENMAQNERGLPFGNAQAALSELGRRLNADPQLQGLRGHIHWSEESSMGGLTASDQDALNRYISGEAAKRDATGGQPPSQTQRSDVRDEQVRDNIAEHIAEFCNDPTFGGDAA
jgi:hypothetical protein